MSSAAARRRKQQLLKKKQSAEDTAANGSTTNADPDANDAIIVRLQNLLAQSSETSTSEAEAESVAYEALQLAQSHVRKCVKLGDGNKAFRIASNVIIRLLTHRGAYVAMASQLSIQMMDAMVETHTVVTEEILAKMKDVDAAYRTALDQKKKELATTTANEEEGKKAKVGGSGGNNNDDEEDDEDDDEAYRLQRLHLQFLRKAVKWSDMLGTKRFGDLGLHSYLADCAWDMGEHVDAVLHYAMAEQPMKLSELLLTLPPLTKSEDVPGKPSAERDALLTRAVLVFVAVENMRDANVLVRAFIDGDSHRGRDPKHLAKIYMAKDATRRPTHVTFCSMLLRTCETTAAPLYNWLIKSFSKELTHYPDLQPYTTKIGRVYFGIQPPPSMMNMMENMMAMMGGAAAMGGGGGGMPPGMMM